MAILDFIKPDKVILLETTTTKGSFEFRPLEAGYGVTIGNAVRRVLLSSLEGYAITQIRISGVDHEFATIPGVVDDVTNLILNLKQVRFKKLVEGECGGETVKLHVSKEREFLAGEFNKVLTHFQVLNTDLRLCEMDESADFEIEIKLNKGRGYIPADAKRTGNEPIGTIPIDSIYTPIRNVKYTIEPYRVEQRTDYEKLLLEIETDGSIAPQETLVEAAKILIYHFQLFSDKKIVIEEEVKKVEEENQEETIHMRQLLDSKLQDMELSVRALNCLRMAEIETLGQLVRHDRSELLKFRNFGKKSLTELDDLLARNDLSFGMNTSKYYPEETSDEVTTPSNEGE